MSEIKVDTVAEKTSANGVTVDGLNIKDSKLVTSNSVVAGNITADAIDATKIADNAISEEHLDVTAVTGHTAETSIADGDTILIHDASASALRKMTKANFVSGIGGTNTPAFLAFKSSVQDVSDNATTKITFTSEKFDTDNTFASSKFTPGVSGKYFIYSQVGAYPLNNVGVDMTIILYKNGSDIGEFRRGYASDAIQNNGTNALSISAVVDSDTNDYFEVYYKINTSDGVNARIDYNSTGLMTFFGGYKLIT
tara:strand:- start:223 stop:981 length:759 start_codon:yes stop_codon:yes gene_type:complete